MATLSDLIVKLGIDATNFTGNIDTAMGKLDSFGSAAFKIGGVLSAAITVPLTALGVGALDAAVELESLRNGLIAITGSAQEADTQLTALKEVAKLPGLGFQEAVQGAINLQAVGFSAKESQEILTVFGNALASVGRGREDLNEVIRQLGQLASRGTVTADNLKPLIERVPQLATVMKQLWGTIDTEALQKMGVDSQTFVSMVITELGKLPPVTGGLKNDLENLKDTWKFALGEIGDAIAPLVSTLVAVAVPAIQSMADSFSALDPSMQTAVVVIGAVAAAIGPLLLGLGSLAFSITSISGAIGGGAGLVSILSAVPPVLAAIAAGWAAWELGSWLSTLEPVRSAFSSLWEGLQSLWNSVTQLGTALAPLWEALKSIATAAGAIVGVLIGAGLIVAVQTLGAAFSGASVIMNAAVFVINSIVNALKEVWSWILKIPGVQAIVDAAGTAFDGLNTKTSNLATTTQGLKNAQSLLGDSVDFTASKIKSLQSQIASAEKELADLTEAHGNARTEQKKEEGVVGELTETLKRLKAQIETVKKAEEAQKKAIEDWNKEVDRLNKVNKEAAEKLAAKRTELVKLHEKVIDAKDAAELWRLGIIEVNGQLVNFQDEAEVMVDRIGDIERATKSLKDMAGPAFGGLSGGIQQAADRMATLDDAYKTLGQTSKDESDKIIAKAHEAAEAILGDPNATEFAKRTAIYKALKIQVEQAEAMGESVPQETRDALAAMETELKTNLPAKFENPWKDSIQNVSTNITNAAQSMVGILIGTEEGSVGDALKKLGQSVLTSFTEPALAAFNKFITEGIKAAIGWLIGSGGLTEALGSVASKIGDVLGIGGGAAGGAAEAAGGAAGGAGQAAGGAASTAGQAAGQGLSGVVGVVSGVVSAISSVIGNFQMAKMETSLNAIEHNTRYTMMYVGERADGGILGVLFKIHETLSWGTLVKATETIRDEILNLGTGYINPSLDSIKTSLQSLVTSGFTGTSVATLDVDSSGYLSTIAAWDLPSKIIDFQLWLDAKLTAVAQWISPTAGALVGGIAPQQADNAAPVVQLPAAPQRSQPIGGYLSDLFKPSHEQSKEVNDGLSAISDGLQSFQSLYAQRSEALFELVSGIGSRVQDQFLGLRDSIAGIGGEIVAMKEMLWRVMTESYDVLREVTNEHLAMIQESVAVLPKMAAASAGGSQPIVIQNILDGRIISEIVIDNLGRQLNQSGQILR